MNLQTDRLSSGEKDVTLKVLDEDGHLLLNYVEHAQALRARLRGLLGRDRLPPDHGMLIDPCRSIHTFGMRFPIDVFFLDAGGGILHIARDVRPWRAVWAPLRTRTVLETAVSSLPSDLAPGNILRLVSR